MDLITVILSGIMSSIFVFFSINNFLKEKFNIKLLIIFSSIMLPLGVLSCLFLTGVTKLTSIILITTIALYFSLCNKSISKSIYYALVYELIAAFIEIVICLFEIIVLNFNEEAFYSSPIFILITTIINLIIVYLVCKIRFVSKSANNLYNISLKKVQDWIYIFIVALLLIFLVAYNGYNFKNNISFYANIGMIIFTVITLFFIMHNKIKSTKLENNYNEMMDYVQKYEKIINDQGKKNHEYNNQLMVIKGYSHDPKKLEEYLDTIIEDHKCGQNYTIRQLSNFPDGGIKGLIYHKIGKMDDNNIKYYLYIDKDSKNIFEEKFDLKTYQDITKLLGVFLDNAIDATKEAKEKEIEIEIRKEDTCIIMTISNTYNDNLDIKQIGKKGFTTKGKGHGYGLSIVKDINKHNENIETFNDVEDDKFTQTILIYYK